MNQINKMIGSRIKKRRLRLGMTQSNLYKHFHAERKNTTKATHSGRSTISRIESGTMSLSITQLYYLARGLKCTVQQLLPKSTEFSLLEAK